MDSDIATIVISILTLATLYGLATYWKRRSVRIRKHKQHEMDKANEQIWKQRLKADAGEDIAEYAVMLAVILVLVIGTVKIVGSNANNTFSTVASSMQ